MQYCKEALRIFFERFLEVFEPWTPTKSTAPVSAAQNAAQAAAGCKAGHPSSILAAIVEAVERISTDFGRGEEPCNPNGRQAALIVEHQCNQQRASTPHDQNLTLQTCDLSCRLPESIW